MKVIRNLKTKVNIWSILATVLILLILLPNLNILVNIFNDTSDNWQHIKDYLLKDYVVNSMILIVFTGFFTIVIGVGLSWLISIYEFPMRNFLKWALILPLAIPPYIAAYTYHGLLNYTGVIQTFLRNNLDLVVNQKYFDIMTIQGAVFIYTMFLFPYVYIITKSYLEKQSSSLIENARVLGRDSKDIFLHVALPISRAAIVGGVSLVILEVLNDYGVVQYFGIPTFSTAIFTTWFSMGDVNSAIKLAGILMFIVFGILSIEKLLRGRKRYSHTTTKIRPINRIELTGWRKWSATAFSGTIFTFGFIIPTLQLTYWAAMSYENVLSPKFFSAIKSTVFVALVAAVIITVIALIVAANGRINKGIVSKTYSKISIMGYSIPGSVIAIGIITVFIALDNALYDFYKWLDPTTGKLVLSTSVAMLIAAYIIRFLAISFNNIDSGYEKMGDKFREASRTLGMSHTKTFFKVDLKLLTPAILSGFLLVFVDILKELPVTLILRPFNFETLSTITYQYANDEMIHEAAVPSLIIILISVISIIVFQRIGEKRREKHVRED